MCTSCVPEHKEYITLHHYQVERFSGYLVWFGYTKIFMLETSPPPENRIRLHCYRTCHRYRALKLILGWTSIVCQLVGFIKNCLDTFNRDHNVRKGRTGGCAPVAIGEQVEAEARRVRRGVLCRGC